MLKLEKLQENSELLDAQSLSKVVGGCIVQFPTVFSNGGSQTDYWCSCSGDVDADFIIPDDDSDG